MDARREIAAFTLSLLAVGVPPPASGDEEGLAGLSLDELLAVKVGVASQHEQTVRRAPGSLAIITAEDIERFGYRTLAEALASVPGFFVGYDRNYTYLGVRGFGRPADYNNRVLVMIEEHRLNEDFYGYVGMGADFPLDLRAVERIEVVRGPGSASFGAGAMLATVNLVLKRPADLAADRLTAETGSFGRRRGELLLGHEWERDGGVLLSGLRSEVDGDAHFYPELAAEEGGGRVAGQDWEDGHGALVTMDRGRLRLFAFDTHAEKGVPTASYDSIPGADERTVDRWSALDLRYERRLRSHLTWTGRAATGSNSYDGRYPFVDGVFLDANENRWWSGETELRWEPRADSRLVAGVSHRQVARSQYRSLYEDGVVTFDADFPYHLWSAYAEQEYQPSERWILTLGLRRDAYSRAGSSTNPRLAVVFVPTGRDTFKVLYGRAFRAPTVYETDYEVTTESKPNPDLQAETIQTLEAVWERRLGTAWLANVSAYAFDIDNLIDQAVDEQDGLVQFRNIGSVYARGVDLELAARWRTGWTARAAWSLQRAIEESGHQRLTNSPTGQVRLSVSAPLGPAFRLSSEVLYETGRRTVQATATSAYWLANANLSWRPAGRPFDCELQVRNLLDEDYAFPGGLEHRQAAIRQDGRTYALRLGLRF